MKLIIDIPKEKYKRINEDARKSTYYANDMMELADALKDSTPLDRITNGEVIQALFPNAEFSHDKDPWLHIKLIYLDETVGFPETWWNAPYQKGGE